MVSAMAAMVSSVIDGCEKFSSATAFLI
jgi:hypothetical protein